MASEARVTTDSIRKSARQLMQEYRAGRSIEGDDVANIAHDLEDAAAEIARLTRELEEARRERSAARAEAMTAQASLRRAKRELEEARERVLGVRSAVIRAAAALVRLDLRWDPREEAEWVRRRPVVEIAMRLKDEVLALSTPQEASGV